MVGWRAKGPERTGVTTPIAILPASPVGSRFKRLPTGSGLIVLYIALAIFVAVVDPRFFHGQNLQIVLSQNAGLAVTVVGMAYVIIGGAYDLSVGGIAGLSGVLFAKFSLTQPIALSIAESLGVCLACGLVNGFIVARLRVNSFMATFATGLVLSGIALYYQGSQEIVNFSPQFSTIGLSKWGPIPECIVLLVAVFIIGGLILQCTKFGQDVYAIGGNREAARLAGVRVNRTWGLTFVMSAFLSGLGGVLIASQLGLGAANSGTNLPIEAIAAVVVGGISVYGGEGKMWRAALGLLILATLNNVFIALSWSTQLQEVAEGLVILLALGANLLTRRAEMKTATSSEGKARSVVLTSPVSEEQVSQGTK